MKISEFLEQVSSIHKAGNATEHSYRSPIQQFIQSFDRKLTVQNEPQRLQKVGAPDFSIHRDVLPVGYIEAKDLGVDLRPKKGSNKEQQERYKKALPNLVYTDGLQWDFYRNGQLVNSVRVADFQEGVFPLPEKFEALTNAIREFIAEKTTQKITSSKALAEIMAGKAILIKDILFNSLRNDKEASINSELFSQYDAFKDQLIHDITIEDFADIYAETVAYGFFAARLHDLTSPTFSRFEALELLPKSNPFLRNLFSYIAGSGLDDRIAWIIDDFVKIFLACDLNKIMANFGKFTGRQDPFLHFYEDFLSAYNPSKKEKRGVWYTPEPVVIFMVRAVDYLLQNAFSLPLGLADTTKIRVDWDTGQRKLTQKGKFTKDGRNSTESRFVHKVQILDPATGTGTFLAEVIKQVAPRVQNIAPAKWSGYIEADLIPRIHGFELLMASYAMCHMKLDMILTELGYKPTGMAPRLGVYLTNSLEKGEPADQTLPFAQWLAREVKAASEIKEDMPIMCVIGNPPYQAKSENMGENFKWITQLIETYKYVDGIHFGERKHHLNDDYVKFMRLAQSYIEKNGSGIMSFITNRGYLFNPTMRGMRQQLLGAFSKIYVLDLHGETDYQEETPTGEKDENIFDIKKGVSIIIAVRSENKANEVTELRHFDLWGKRLEKYAFLESKSLEEIDWQLISPSTPQYSFKPFSKDKDGDNSYLEAEYEKLFPIKDIFMETTTGIQTSRDLVALGFTNDELEAVIDDFEDNSISDMKLREKYFKKTSKKYPAGDTRDWKLSAKRKSMNFKEVRRNITPYSFRPLDIKMIALHSDLVSWPRFPISKHMLKKNVSLITARSNKSGVDHFFCAKCPSDVKCGEASTGSIFIPLYLYPDDDVRQKDAFAQTARRPNLQEKFVKKFGKAIGLKFICDHELPEAGSVGTFHPLDLFDYVYAVFYSPTYRETYKEFLKIDYPRAPIPASVSEFWRLARLGGELRGLHVMDSDVIGAAPYPFEGSNDEVECLRYEDNKVYINGTGYFANVPEIAWNFNIGGYQPGQKWLKDRKGRKLSFGEIMHYQFIIKILCETDRIMKEIG